MKNFIKLSIFLAIFIGFANAQDMMKVNDGGDVGEDVEPTVTIRSLYSGVVMDAGSVRMLLDTNWILREINLDGETAKKFPNGAVQFLHAKFTNLCLALNNDGNLTTAECGSFTTFGSNVTLFSLLPTNSGAVQIQAFNGEQCITVANSAAEVSFKKFGLRNCELNERLEITMENLFVIGVPQLEAKVIK